MLLRQLQEEDMDICHGCYIKENSIFTEKDLIDPYREEIIGRLK